MKKQHKKNSERMKTVKIADRLCDIAARITVAQLAIEGAEAEVGTGLLSPVITFLGVITDEVRVVAEEVHPSRAHEIGDALLPTS